MYYDRDNDVEYLFNQEVRDKKRVGYGVYHRASRKGYIKGGVKTQVDFLKGKEKKQYMGNGEIIVSNIYKELDKVPSLEELEKMPIESAKKIILAIKEFHNNKVLMKYWKVSSYTLYNKIFKKYGIEVHPHRDYSKKTENKANKKPEITKEVSVSEAKPIEVEKVLVQNNMPSVGFKMARAGTYDYETLNKIVTRMMAALLEDKKYIARIEFEEID